MFFSYAPEEYYYQPQSTLKKGIRQGKPKSARYTSTCTLYTTIIPHESSSIPEYTYTQQHHTNTHHIAYTLTSPSLFM